MTRDEFLAAVRVLEEGRPTHSMYAVEDAKRVLKPIARYWWRHVAILTFFVLVALQIVPDLLPSLARLAAYLVGAVGGSLVTWAVMNIPLLRGLFAPPGLSATDVAKAARHVLA